MLGRSKYYYFEDVFCLLKVFLIGFRLSVVRLGVFVFMLFCGLVFGFVGVGGSDGNDGSLFFGLDFRMEVGVFWVGLVVFGFDRSGGGGGVVGMMDLGGGMFWFIEIVRDKNIIYSVMNVLFKFLNKDLWVVNISF